MRFIELTVMAGDKKAIIFINVAKIVAIAEAMDRETGIVEGAMIWVDYSEQPYTVNTSIADVVLAIEACTHG
jgi:hypothetical protein